jgi:hypothetical protein
MVEYIGNEKRKKITRRECQVKKKKPNCNFINLIPISKIHPKAKAP